MVTDALSQFHLKRPTVRDERSVLSCLSFGSSRGVTRGNGSKLPEALHKRGAYGEALADQTIAALGEEVGAVRAGEDHRQEHAHLRGGGGREGGGSVGDCWRAVV